MGLFRPPSGRSKKPRRGEWNLAVGGAGAFGAAKPTVNAKNNRTAQRWQEKPRRSGGKKPRRGGENLAVGEAGAFGAAKPTDFGAAKPTVNAKK